MHYIYIDRENRPALDPELFYREGVQISLFLGTREPAEPFQINIHSLRGKVEVVRTKKSGKNATDFVLACELGIQSQRDSSGSYHIVSGDTGFNALIDHLLERGINIQRHNSLETLLAALNGESNAGSTESTPSPSSNELVVPTNGNRPIDGTIEKMARYLKTKRTRPRTKARLAGAIKSHLGKSVSDVDVPKIIEHLVAKHILTLTTKGSVTYP